MRVSVVLCTYTMDMYEHFEDAAESIFDQSYGDVELVIVVDGSETVCEQVQGDYGDREDVVIHCNDDNVGLLESRNTGAEVASGDVVAFIDDDAVADSNWVSHLVEAYDEQKPPAAGGKMEAKWVDEKPVFLPEEFYWLIGVTHRGFADGPGFVRNTFGSNISFKRDVFLELGGFDTDIGGRKGEKNLQGGETELCARMQQNEGMGVWYVPNATVEHKVFDYRTDVKWLLDRAFWQGYSKRVMEKLLPETGGEETAFLGRLLTDFVPSRVKGMVKSPSQEKLIQLVMLFIFTFFVGSGYLYGEVRWTLKK